MSVRVRRRQYCWRIFEDFHCQEDIKFIETNCGLIMRLHFTIGCYDLHWISRRRRSIHFSSIQILFADHVHRRTGVDNKFSFRLMQAGTYFPSVRKMLFYLSPSILGCFWPTSTLFRGHIALAIPSLPETDPQIWGHWGCADEVHLGKYIRAKDFGLECWHDVPRL